MKHKIILFWRQIGQWWVSSAERLKILKTKRIHWQNINICKLLHNALRITYFRYLQQNMTSGSPTPSFSFIRVWYNHFLTTSVLSELQYWPNVFAISVVSPPHVPAAQGNYPRLNCYYRLYFICFWAVCRLLSVLPPPAIRSESLLSQTDRELFEIICFMLFRLGNCCCWKWGRFAGRRSIFDLYFAFLGAARFC